jgi:hypothetical protein
MWLPKALLRTIFPELVVLNLLAAPRFVFNLGIYTITSLKNFILNSKLGNILFPALQRLPALNLCLRIFILPVPERK